MSQTNEGAGESGEQADQQPEDIVEAAVMGSWREHEWLLNYLDLPFQMMVPNGGAPRYGLRLLFSHDGKSLTFACDGGPGVEIPLKDVIRDLLVFIDQIQLGKATK